MRICSTRKRRADGWDPRAEVSQVKHLVRTEDNLSDSQFYEGLKHRRIVLFFHGWRTPAPLAIERAETLQRQFNMMYGPQRAEVILMMWPCSDTDGIRPTYHHDKQPCKDSAKIFAGFIADVCDMSDDVHVFTHSMGARAFTYALAYMFKYIPAAHRRILSLHMFAPDVPAGMFDNTLTDRDQRGLAVTRSVERSYVYFNKDDRALDISAVANLTKRMGDEGPARYPSCVFGVDCQNVADEGLGHTYFIGKNRGLCEPPTAAFLAAVARMSGIEQTETAVSAETAYSNMQIRMIKEPK